MTTLPTLYWLYLSALALGSLLGVLALLGGNAVDMNADAGAGAELESGEPGVEADSGGFWAALGLGRLPIGLLMALLLLYFGGLGVIGSESLELVLSSSGAAIAALPLALVGALLLGSKSARLIARRIPTEESYVATRDDLLGRIGYAEIVVDATFGRAKIKDDGGAVHLVRCHTNGDRIERGCELVLIDRDPTTGIYTAVAADWLPSPRRSV